MLEPARGEIPDDVRAACPVAGEADDPREAAVSGTVTKSENVSVRLYVPCPFTPPEAVSVLPTNVVSAPSVTAPLYVCTPAFGLLKGFVLAVLTTPPLTLTVGLLTVRLFSAEAFGEVGPPPTTPPKVTD